MLGEVVGKILCPFTPEDVELILSNPVSDQIKAHVDGFGSFLFDSIIDNAVCTRVVSLNGSWS